jgi:hypothetical protein
MLSDGFGEVVAVGILRTMNFGSIEKKAWLTVSATNNIVSERQHGIIILLTVSAWREVDVGLVLEKLMCVACEKS